MMAPMIPANDRLMAILVSSEVVVKVTFPWRWKEMAVTMAAMIWARSTAGMTSNRGKLSRMRSGVRSVP